MTSEVPQFWDYMVGMVLSFPTSPSPGPLESQTQIFRAAVSNLGEGFLSPHDYKG